MATQSEANRGSDGVEVNKSYGQAKKYQTIFDETFSSKSGREDTALIVEDKRVYVSSTFLSLASPVFSEMFEDDDGDERKHELPGKKYKEILEFVQCIYPNIMKEITQENVFNMLRLAVEYEVKFLKERCETFLFDEISETTSIETLCLYLANVSEYKLGEKLQDKCIKQAGMRDFQEVCDAETKHPIPPDSKVKIQKGEIEKLNKKIVELKEENDTYKTIIKRGDMKEIWFYDDFDDDDDDDDNGDDDDDDDDDDYVDKGVPNLKDYRASYLNHTVNVSFKESTSTQVSVHGIKWNILVRKDEKSKIEMFLDAMPEENCIGWFCRVYAKFCLRKKNDINGSIYRRLDHIFTVGSSGFGFGDFTNGKLDLKEEGFVDGSDKLFFEIKFLVEKPVFFGL